MVDGVLFEKKGETVQEAFAASDRKQENNQHVPAVLATLRVASLVIISRFHF